MTSPGSAAPSFGQVDSSVEFEDDNDSARFSFGPVPRSELVGDSPLVAQEPPPVLEVAHDAHPPHTHAPYETTEELDTQEKIQNLESRLLEAETNVLDMSKKKVEDAL